MVRKQQHPTLLPVPVLVTVHRDLSVDFRGMNFSLRGIPDLVSGHQVTITHYNWHHNEITIGFTNGFGVTHYYIADGTDPAMACA
ncbi:hypothetical protein EW514_15820 [Salmonella enterica subsp. enterica serovar Napoli]|uniref:hypothetical protein n=1 Tax=Salmonella enterica TaxID=28901 RepID=UPI001384D030|nr:hypothetical protein [Salmonella enterica subsp. enterica serovar Napoli]